MCEIVGILTMLSVQNSILSKRFDGSEFYGPNPTEAKPRLHKKQHRQRITYINRKDRQTAPALL